MMPTPRSQQPTPSSSSSSKPKPTLEILPDLRFIVFHGGEHEAASVTLTGRVRLTTPEPTSILKPKVRLEGKRRIKFHSMPERGVNHRGIADEKRVFWNLEQKLGVDTAHKVKAGVMEWPFSFELSPSMPESVEGLRDTFIAYHIHASVSRPGWNAKDIVAQEHIRLVRTLGPGSMGTTRSRVNADIWSNKLSYNISIPSDAVVFGTSIVADVELSPIRKGIKLGKIELKLVETVVRRIQHTEVPDTRNDTTKTEETEVAKAELDFPEDSRVLFEDETIENPMLADEMYKFKAALPLPKTLNECRQDVDSHPLNITHRFKLMLNIHNPEGHVSQLVCRLPVKLFISPNLPLNDNNEILNLPDRPSDEQLNDTEMSLAAPPEYGMHQLDMIYSDDPTIFMSRAASVPGTPAGLSAISRRGSSDNLQSLNGVADADSSAIHGSAVPHQLRARLTDLQENGMESTSQSPTVTFANTTPGSLNSPIQRGTASSDGGNTGADRSSTRQTPLMRNESGYFGRSSNRRSPQDSTPASARVSDEDHASSIQQQDYDMGSLTRVPSYGAALRTPGSVTPFTAGPPSYVEATSRPPSRPSSPQPAGGLARPGLAHVRGRSPDSHSSQQTLMQGAADLSMTQRQPPEVQQDEEARLHRMRAAD